MTVNPSTNKKPPENPEAFLFSTTERFYVGRKGLVQDQAARDLVTNHLNLVT